MISILKSFWHEDEGLTVLEYVIGAALLAAAIGTVFSTWGTKLGNELNKALP
jgi:pilus assembly protein Flp/PilA